MTANLEWGVAHELVSGEGTIDLNVPIPDVLDSGLAALYLLRPNPYKIVPGLRKTSLDISQADGSSPQPRYLTGLVASLYVEYWVQQDVNDDASRREPACEQDLRQMDQLLTLHLNALRSYCIPPNVRHCPDLETVNTLIWQPTGTSSRRMMPRVRLSAWQEPEPFDSGGGIGWSVTFELSSPLSYAVDETPVNTAIAPGTSETIVNAGNVGQKPIVQVAGPCSEFVVTNENTGEVVSYSENGIGGVPIPSGHYAEIDFFTGEIALDGDFDPDHHHDLIAGIDPAVTNFFSLAPGPQVISASPGSGEVVVISAAAWG